jgi:carbamoyltransferase
VDLLGPPRPPEAPFFTRSTGDDLSGREKEAQENQYYADVASSIQKLTEETLLKVVNHLAQTTGLTQLVMAGGVALNSVANGRIMRETPFREVFIQPNAGDAGGALGAALYAYHVVLGKPRRHVMEHAYYGEAYGPDRIRGFLESRGVPFELLDDVDRMAARVAQAIEQGRVVSLFQGGFEWGPRALGNRSILAAGGARGARQRLLRPGPGSRPVSTPLHADGIPGSPGPAG